MPFRRSTLTFVLSAAAACGGDAIAPPANEPGCGASGGVTLSLTRGATRLLSDPATLSCITVGVTADASEYLFISANALSTQDDLATYLVRADAGSRATPAIAAAPAFATSSEPLAFRDALEDRARRRERALLAGRSVATIAAAARRAGTTTAAAVPKLGDTLALRVGDASTANLCTAFTDVRATVKAVGTRVVIAQDNSAAPRGFTDADFRDIAAEFDTLIYSTMTQWFGNPSDVNGDTRITILFTPAINRLTPPGSLGYVGGFFFLSDLLPRSVPSQGWRCDASNEQEMLYLLAPDPDGRVNGNRVSVATARETARGTSAHELQHLINQGMRQATARADDLEVPWLNEALSHFAEEVVGRAARRFSDTRRLSYSDVLVDLDDFDSFFRQNLIRFRLWMQRPDLASPISEKAASQLAPRGAGWALLRYAVDRYAGSDQRAFVRALVAGPEVDVPNLEARARAPFADILPGFLVANFAEPGVPGLDARFTYASWAMRDVMTEVNGGVFPLFVTTLPSETTTQSLSGSGNYFVLTRAAGAAAVTFRMLSPSRGPVEFRGARVYVVRVR